MRARCDDVDVAWFEAGRGEPLVLVHGLADDHRAWRRTLPDLVLRHRVLLYDLRGHGQSTLGKPDGSLRQLGEDLVGLLDALEIQRARIAGFSLGGTIAMRVAIDHPDRVDKLVLVATSSRVGRTAAGWYRERLSMVKNEDSWLRETLGRQSTADARGYGNACAAMAALFEAPLDPELGHIPAPTLIVASDLDQHCPPRAAEIIHAGIPGSRIELIKGAGHAVPVERPGELAAAMNRFLS